MYKLTIYPAWDADNEGFTEQEFKTLSELLAAKETAANLLLYIQDEMRLMGDYSNMFIKEIFVDGEWEEYDEVIHE